MPKLEWLTEQWHQAYDALLERSPGAMLYYSLRYKAMLEELVGCSGEYWIVQTGDQVSGILPVMAMTGPEGRVINSLPFHGSHGGVFATDADSEVLLWNKYLELAGGEDVAAAMYVANPIRPQPAPVLTDAIGGRVLTDFRISQMTPLPAWTGEEMDWEARLLASFDGSARRNLRKAEKAGVMVHIDTRAISFLRDVHFANMAAMGGTAKPAEFFDIFPRHFQPDRDYRIYVAKQGERDIAALLVFYFAGVVEYFVPVTIEEARNSQPMSAIVFQAMKDAAKRGCSTWNWGGTWPTQDGVYRFKRKWGATETRYDYHIIVQNETLLSKTPAELLTAYPRFYVVPFSALKVTG